MTIESLFDAAVILDEHLSSGLPILFKHSCGARALLVSLVHRADTPRIQARTDFQCM